MEAAQPLAISNSTVDAEVQCDLIEAPPLKRRRRLVNVVTGIPQPATTAATDTPTVPAPSATTDPGPAAPPQPQPQTGQQEFSFAEYFANPIYQDLYPVTLDNPQTTWILPHPVVGSLPYVHLPAMVPPPTPTNLQSSASEVAVTVPPTNHVEAPDDIATSDDDWDPYSGTDSSSEGDTPQIQPMDLNLFLRNLRSRATDIRTLKHDWD